MRVVMIPVMSSCSRWSEVISCKLWATTSPENFLALVGEEEEEEEEEDKEDKLRSSRTVKSDRWALSVRNVLMFSR